MKRLLTVLLVSVLMPSCEGNRTPVPSKNATENINLIDLGQYFTCSFYKVKIDTVTYIVVYSGTGLTIIKHQ